MGKLVNLRSCLALISALACSSQAEAGGKLLSRSSGVRVTEARVALAQGPSRASTWYQLRVEGSADELFWLLPVPPGAGADLSTTSFFDALEESTAPRVLPPASKPPPGCSKPAAPETVTTGDAEAALAVVGQDVFSDEASLSARLADLGYAVDPIDQADFSKIFGAGGRALGLRLGAPAGAASTVTVRLHGEGLGLGALPLMRARAGQSIPWTLWLLGDGRGKAGGVGEAEIVPSALRWVLPGQTNYASLRGSMLEKAKGASLILEAAGPGPLRELSSVSGVTIPAFVDAYLKRAFERGEGSFDLGSSSEGAKAALLEVSPEPCPRGDLLSHSGFSCPEPPPASLVPASSVDDLAFVFAGDAAQRWVSRLAGLIPAVSVAPAITASFVQGETVSLLYTPASVWEGLCSTPSGQGGATGSGGVGAGNTGGKTGGVTPGTGAAAGSSQEVQDEPSSSSSCNAIILSDGCNGDSSSGDGSSSDSCNCNDTSPAEEGGSSEGCSCDDSSGSGDSCDSGDSSGGGDSCSGSEGSGGGDACGSGSSGGGESCSGGSSGGGSSCANDCSVGKKKPPRLSKWLVLLAAVALPLRRATRPVAKKKVVAG